MIDLYLRASNEEMMANYCSFLRKTDKDGNKQWIINSENWALDIIGIISLKEEVIDEKANELNSSDFNNYFHMNLRCSEELATIIPHHFKINPTNPIRVWA